MWSWTLPAVACLGVCATACLPRGGPPVGRQVISDRSSFLTGVVPPTSDGILRLLVTRASADGTGNDLYVVSVPDNGPPSERLLVDHLPSGAPCPPRDSGWIAGPCYTTDARGRLYLYTSVDLNRGTWGIGRIDPVTGERLDLGDGTYFFLSPARDRVVVSSFVDDTLFENDGQATTLAGVGQGIVQFVGEDLFYLGPGQGLLHLPPHAVPESVRAGVTGFSQQPTQSGPLLITTTPGADPNFGRSFVLDPVTLEDLFAPVENDPISVSPDRRWLLVDHLFEQRLTFIDGITGVQEEVGPLDSGMRNNKEWRPGHAEVWYQIYATDPAAPPSASTWIKAPGKAAVEVPFFSTDLSDDRRVGSFFTSDGAYWFSIAPSRGEQRPAVRIGPADDPNGAHFDLSRSGTYIAGYNALADGRLLVSAFYTDFQRSDISAVDPATGARQLLGEQGTVLVVGERRLLANLHMIDGYGDLTAIDLADGHATQLAAEFTYTAFVEPQAADPDAAKPGARVAFQFRARFDSPYDGIWVTALP